METTRFSLTYDYRCPFARNAHDHVVTAMQAGAPFEVFFTPFVLGGAGGTDGTPLIWDNPAQRPNLIPLAASVVVREQTPDKFLDVHQGLFNLRHSEGGDLRSEDVIRGALDASGTDAAAVFKELDDGWPFEMLRKEHESSILEYDVWGVPTFIANEQAAFVRLMNRPEGDATVATTTVQTILTLLYEHVEINEFKHTSVPQ